jgi:hypothetical protein
LFTVRGAHRQIGTWLRTLSHATFFSLTGRGPIGLEESCNPARCPDECAVFARFFNTRHAGDRYRGVMHETVQNAGVGAIDAIGTTTSPFMFFRIIRWCVMRPTARTGPRYHETRRK